MKKHPSEGLNRRDFLTNALAAIGAFSLPPVYTLADILVRGLIQKAIAAEGGGGQGTRQYVNLLLAGAPLRFSFDQWVRTRADDPQLEHNPMVITSLNHGANGLSGGEYKTMNYNNVLVPNFFSHSVIGSAGARPLTQLLDNMLVIRGYGTGVDGHPSNFIRQMSPLGGVSSISGLAADESSRIFPCVRWPSRDGFASYNSVKNKALNLISGPQPLQGLMEGFAPQPSSRAGAGDLLKRQQEAFDLARRQLRAYAKSDRPGAKVLAGSVDDSLKMLKRGIANVEGYWAEAHARYKTLIEASIQTLNLPGLSDGALVSGPDVLPWRVMTGDGKQLFHNGDFRDVIRSMRAPAYLIESFALTEYVLREQLATSVEIMVDRFGATSIAGHGTHELTHDMHDTGNAASLLLTTAHFRGISAAMLELIDRLKQVSAPGGNLWDETVLQVSSEFGRCPRTDGSGSDHGFNAMVTSVYSGAIQQGPFVVGNVRTRGLDHDPYRTGSQGIGAPIQDYNQSGIPTPLMAASNMAVLLRSSHNPFENSAQPLIRMVNGKMQVLKPGRLIEGV